MKKSILYIFSGLPASGKSTLASELARKTNAVFVRIDTVEQSLKDICGMDKVEEEGYRISHNVCRDNLLCGNNVIADSVNAIKICRDEWMEVASSVDCSYVNIEVTCSNKEEHRSRLESRDNGVVNLKNPSWEQVTNREYDQWETPIIKIDTAGKSVEECFEELLRKLSQN